MTDLSTTIQTLYQGSIDDMWDELWERASIERLMARLAQADPGLWSDDPQVRNTIANRLGWLRVASSMLARLDEVETFARSAREDELTDVVLLGMGGSSLCPTVLAKMFDRPRDRGQFIVLDSTDPDTVLRAERSVDLQHTLFLSASKSGRTVETLSHTEYFWSRMSEIVGDRAGRHFAAVTDEGSHLQALARERGFRQVFINPSDIGGRYSALSFFGLVAAALIGVPLQDFMRQAVGVESASLSGLKQNDALDLGLFLGASARDGKDKLTFLASTRMAPLVPWIEQLIAESTGKSGVGIVPIEAEPLVKLEEYGDDRAFIVLRLADDTDPTDGLLEQLVKDNRPAAEITLPDLAALGGEFLRWELATAIAGWALNINPFDEPNVQESKDNTNKVLETIGADGRLALPKPIAEEGDLTVLRASNGGDTVDETLTAWWNALSDCQYVAILAYVDESTETEALLARLRKHILTQTKRATLRGYGPRYLHSIGQLYKGGPQVGAFLLVSSDSTEDAAIPNVPYSFQSLKVAQVLGDSESLESRNRPLVHVHLGSLLPGLRSLVERMERYR
ncbi:MAG: hypothetical protein Kow0074_03920 [Candidatus Zixiibacteriota bacterium]